MNILPCFENYIGVRSLCDSVASVSGLYIDDLEGIDIEVASSISNGYDTGADVLRKSIASGINLTLMDFKTYARPYYRIKSVLNYTSIGRFNKTYYPLPGNTLLRGVRIRVTETTGCTSCPVNQSNMQRLYIEKLDILGYSDCTHKQVIIQDGDAYTYYNVDLTAGRVSELYTRYRAQTDEVIVWIDNWDFQSNQGEILNYYRNSGGCCGGGRGSYHATRRSIIVDGWDGANSTNYLYGINPHIKISCDEDLLYCALADKLKYLFLYRSGIEFSRRWKVSPRYNEHTEAQDSIDFLNKTWTDLYDKEYKHIQDTFKGILSSFDGCCIECKGIKHIYSM